MPSFNVQNAKALSISEGDVKTIHDSNGQLLWGAVGYDVKYVGDTSQTTYSGKNLFNYQAVSNLALSGSVLQENTNYRGYAYPVQQGQTYTISRAIKTGNNRFRVAFTKVLPAAGVTFYGENGEASSFINLDGYLAGSFSVPNDMNYVFVYLSNQGDTIDASLQIQLEKGETATSYEPYCGGIPSPNPDYPQPISVVSGTQTITLSDGTNTEDFTVSLGSTELCKIGTYQDYIYKDGADWKVHKAVGKVVLDGTEADWIKGATGLNNIYVIEQPDALEPMPFGLCVCDHFRYNNELYTRSEVGFMVSIKSNNVQAIRFGVGLDSPMDTLAKFTAWLGTNNVAVYYPLATATDTTITDTTLIGQLNAIEAWLTRYGYTATVSGSLPLIINQTALT